MVEAFVSKRVLNLDPRGPKVCKTLEASPISRNVRLITNIKLPECVAPILSHVTSLLRNVVLFTGKFTR